MTVQFALVGNEDGSANITVFVNGEVFVAHDSHPNFNKIRNGALLGDDRIADLFDTALTAAKKFERLTDQITVANGRLYWDGEEFNNSLSQLVVRSLNEGNDDWRPLVRFFQNVQSNPNEHSREQLFNWLDRDFTITDEGNIIGYKGVRLSDVGGYAWVSINKGKAIVDGQVFTGAIPNYPGAVVEMPRGEVTADSSIGCHQGLHVGTYDYAKGFAKGALLEVIVNPRDVVSVPTDCDAQKMRVCRYTVVDTVDLPYTSAVAWGYGDPGDEDDYSGWSDGEYDGLDPADDPWF